MPRIPKTMDVEKLIVLVQDRPCIWDTRSGEYHDRYKKDAAWLEITKELFASVWEQSKKQSRQSFVDEVKNRWRSCRDQFRKEMHQQGRSGSGPPKKRPYIFREQLMFLREVMELRPTEDNLDDEAEEAAPLQSSTCEEEVPSSQGPSQREEGPSTSVAPRPGTSGLDSPPTLALPSRRKRHMPAAETVVNSQVLDYLSRARNEDQHDYFGRTIAPHLRNLPPERLLRTQSAIGIVLEAATPPNDPTDIFVTLENWRIHGHLPCPPTMPHPQAPMRQPSYPPPREHYGPPIRPYGPTYYGESSYGQAAPSYTQHGPSGQSGSTSQPPYHGATFHAQPSTPGRFTDL